jgi:uroporphyrinogen-III synthase
MTSRLLVTRPSADAPRVVEALRRMGIGAVVEPLIFIEPVAGAVPDLAGVQAVLATSANGARALARAEHRRDIPLFAVGDATAESARDAGFETVESAAGDVESLVQLVCARLDPAAGGLLHVAGSHVAGDLAARLDGAGFSYRRSILYQARAAERFSSETAQALAEATIDGAQFFSPRTAATFVTLAREARLDGATEGLTAFCLSPAVAERIRDLPWNQVVVAQSPDLESLMACVGTVLGGPIR